MNKKSKTTTHKRKEKLRDILFVASIMGSFVSSPFEGGFSFLFGVVCLIVAAYLYGTEWKMK